MKLLDVLNSTYLGIISYSPLYFNLDINFCLATNLLKDDIERSVVIVTDNVEMMNNILEAKLTSEEELILKEKIVIFDYDNIEMLKSLAKTIIIIDDAKLLYNKFDEKVYFGDGRLGIKKFYREINVNNNYLILTANDSVTDEDLSKVILQKGEVDNKVILLSFKNYFKKDDNSIITPIIDSNTLHPCKLSQTQLFYISEAYKANQNGVNRISNSELKENVNNFMTAAYDKEATKFINEAIYTLPVEGEDIKMPSLEDLYDFLGTKSDQKPYIIRNSPKIISLFDNIFKNINKEGFKHLIYVNTPNDYYGISLIYTTLFNTIQKMKQDGKIGNDKEIVLCYENNPIFKINSVVKNPEDIEAIEAVNEKINNIKIFNEELSEDSTEESKKPLYTIFITNSNLPEFQSDDGTKIEFLKDITDFHIITMNETLTYMEGEQYVIDFDICMDLVKKLFKKNNYKKDISLKIHLYYILERKELKEVLLPIGEDFNNFSHFMSELRKNYKNFLDRWNKGLKLSYNSSSGSFEVEDPPER